MRILSMLMLLPSSGETVCHGSDKYTVSKLATRFLLFFRNNHRQAFQWISWDARKGKRAPTVLLAINSHTRGHCGTGYRSAATAYKGSLTEL